MGVVGVALSISGCIDEGSGWSCATIPGEAACGQGCLILWDITGWTDYEGSSQVCQDLGKIGDCEDFVIEKVQGDGVIEILIGCDD